MDDGSVSPTPAPRSSLDKIADALAGAQAAKPENEKSARLQQALGMMLPLVKRLGVIPEDPAELDELLLRGAAVMLHLRSDGADVPETIAQLLEPLAEVPQIETEALT